APLDGQGPGGHRLRLGGAEQRPGQPQPDQGDLLPAPADVQPDAECPGQQRLQLRDVQNHRPAPGRTTSAHAQQRYLPRPGEHPENTRTGFACACRLTWHLRRAWAPLTCTDQNPPAPATPSPRPAAPRSPTPRPRASLTRPP